METGTLGACTIQVDDDTDRDISELSSEEVAQSSGTNIPTTSSTSMQELPEMDDSDDSISRSTAPDTIETRSELGSILYIGIVLV
jgi:hypothetical protein